VKHTSGTHMIAPLSLNIFVNYFTNIRELD
jgi:hypothetical protein